MPLNKIIITTVLLSMMSVGLTGCASTTATAPDTAKEADPLEPMNRKIYAFNKFVDKYTLKPVAQGYRAVLPTPVRQSVTHFFYNINDITIAANHLLQWKPNDAATDVVRVIVNSTAGVLGFFDVASKLGLQKGEADMGQTFGAWGYKNSTYIVIPLLGPSTVRDGIGIVGDWYASPWPLVDEEWRYGLQAVSFVNKRSNLLDTEAVVAVAAYDEYLFVRNAYIQKRHYMMYEGNIPANQHDEFEDDF